MPEKFLRRLAYLGIPCVLAASPAHAQRQDEQLWTQLNTHVPLGERSRVTLEQIARWGNKTDGLFTTEFGVLLGRKVADNVEIGFGYRYVSFYNGNTGADENRTRQQVVATFGPLSTRFRVDQRFHPGGKEIGFRIRPLVRYNHKIGDDGVALFLSHESFILPNSTGWGQKGGYERMRNIVGVTVPVSDVVDADIGYLNQYRLPRDGARAQMDHALSVQLTIDLADVGSPLFDD